MRRANGVANGRVDKDVSCEGHAPPQSERSRTEDGDNKESLADRLLELYPVLLPPLRVHSPKGRELDTDSQLQRNIRLAKLCHLLGLPEFVNDWKLPKMQVPSRPDFSRNTQPPVYRHTEKHLLPVVAEEQSHYHLEVSESHS